MGIKVLLSGIGGDEVFAGYRRHLLAKYSSLIKIVPMKTLLLLNENFEKLFTRNLFSRRFKRFLNILDNNKNINISNLLRWQSQQDIKNILHQTIQSCFKKNNLADNCKLENNLKSILKIDQNYYLPDHNLNYTDKMSMSCGVEVRVPLIDNRVKYFINTVPDEYLIRNLETKWLLKKVMEKYLPKNLYIEKNRFWITNT